MTLDAMNLILETERLRLTPMQRGDADLVVEIFTDPNVMKYADRPMTEQEVRNDMSNNVKRGGNGWIGVWCVSNRETAEKLGTAALLPMPVEHDATDFSLVVPGFVPDADIEVGYYFKPGAWGKGYATEACTALVRNVLENEYLNEVVASFDASNEASRNVLTKSGFIDHGTMPCYGATGPNFRISKKDL